MEIVDYETIGGKNLILEYISNLPTKEREIALKIRSKIEKDGFVAFEILNTRKLIGKVYEIKFSNQRIAYVIKNDELVYFLHMFQKQKNKTEKKDIFIAIKRAKEKGVY